MIIVYASEHYSHAWRASFKNKRLIKFCLIIYCHESRMATSNIHFSFYSFYGALHNLTFQAWSCLATFIKRKEIYQKNVDNVKKSASLKKPTSAHFLKLGPICKRYWFKLYHIYINLKHFQKCYVSLMCRCDINL